MLLTSYELKRVLSKTPKFRPTPNIIKAKTVASDCDLFGQRLIKTFNRFVCKDFIQRAQVNSDLAGIVPWKPKQFPHSPDYYARHNRDYFDISKPSGYVWKTNHAICPGLEQFIASFKQDTMQTADNIAGRRLRIKPNLRSSERRVVRTVLNKNVGYNDSDKHFGPVLYSRDLYLEQCRKHLFDGKGTYEYTDKPKDLILEDVTRRLKTLLYDCFGTEPATKSLAQTLRKWADDSLKRARLANFYVIWKLHKKANAQGVRSRPISNNIGYPTGQVSHFLHSQLIDSVNAHTHVLKDSLSLIRQLESLSLPPDQNILLTSADVAALYPSINIEDGMKALKWFMAEHSNIPQNLQPKYLKLAR